MEIEYAFSCPYCWQTVTVLLDLSIARQTYIEDCEVCCCPIQMSYATDGEEVTEFNAQPIDS